MDGAVQIVLALIAVVAFVASVAYWRQATIAALVLVIFEGALRKWALPEAQAILYLAKDVLLAGAYIGFAMMRGIAAPVRSARPYIVLLLMAATYGFLAMFNPALPSLTLAAIGWRAYFFYVPLLFMVPHLFQSVDDLYRALYRYVLIAVPIALLGIIQFYSPADSVINTNVQHDAGGGSAIGFGVTDRVRVAGTFAFVTGYAAYLMVIAMLVGALLAARGWTIRGNATLYGALVLVLAAIFATGSRAPVYSLVAVVALYALAAAWAGDLSFVSAFRACVGALILAVCVWYFLPEPAEAFQQRALGAEDTLSRFTSPIVEPFQILAEAGIGGFGIGAAHQSASFLSDSQYSWWTDGMVAEAETSKVMLELGLVGFVLVFLFRIGIAFAALRAAFRFKSAASRSLTLVISMFLGLQIIGSVIFNPTMNVLYWFAVGMFFAISRFEARDALLARESSHRPGRRIPKGSASGRIRNA